MRTMRASTTIPAMLALVLAGVIAPCRSDPGPDRTASAAPKGPVASKWKTKTKTEAPFTVENRAGRHVRAAIVQGGIPFAPGAVRDPGVLTVRAADGTRLPTQARALSFWEDGSARWVLVTSHVSNLAPGAKPSFTLTADASAPRPAAKTAASVFPRGVEFVLVDQRGRAPFVSGSGTSIDAGPLMIETRFSGTLAGRERATESALTVASFPELRAVRYRFSIRQLANGGEWKQLTAVVPHARAFVYQQKEMGAVVRAQEEGSTEIVFVGSREPVDRGVARSWEVWGFDGDPGPFVRPLRPVPPPRYTLATGAAGRIAAEVPERWQKTFDQSVRAIFEKRDANPRNFGWRNYGDFFDREHGLAYYGYLNQEYDPSTALWIAYARTGRLEYFDQAESLADFFRDMCLGPEGGTYQHRATVDAAYATVVFTISSHLETKIKSAPGYKPTPDGLAIAIASAYGEKTGRKAKQLVDAMPATEAFETRQQRLIHQLANSVLKSEEDRLKKKMEKRSQAEVDRVTLKDMMTFYAQSADLQQLGYRNVDEAFAPFFRRYGGSWENFPAFHVDILPDPGKAHTGSHSLLEMLVWAYEMTGDESYREAALRATRYHLDVLVPFVLETYGGSQDKPVESRNVGWPLINLMAAWEITEYRDPDLHREIRAAAGKLARALTRVPVGRHQGGIHAGVSLEALCRYHEKTGDAGCARYITELARFWATSQWSADKNAFNITTNEPGTADASMTGLLLYGMAYANHLAPDAQLRTAIEKATKSLEPESTNYAKRFGQLYRSTPRAFALINEKSK